VVSAAFDAREGSVAVGFRVAILLTSHALYDVARFCWGGSVCIILFCRAVISYNSLLFYAGSKSMKNRFKGSLVILCCAFSMFRVLCPSSSSSCRFLMKIL